MKRLLVLVLTAVMVFSVAACTGGGDKAEGTTLVVGSPAINGNFMTGFGSSAYDVWVRNLINSYGTWATTYDGEIVLNETVVVDHKVEAQDNGDKVYYFKIADDLVFNDETPITAEHYVFYVLWAASPQWADAGAVTSLGEGIVGYNEYKNGKAERFAGVKLISDYEFSLTIDHEELPYFYENAWTSVHPVAMHVWAPGASVETNDDGSKIVFEGGQSARDPMVEATGRVAHTERFAPTVTCGPYKFVSFENNAVTLKRNPHFKATWDGKKPQIENIVIRHINQDTDVDQVINGEVDMVTGVIEGEKIDKANAASSADVNWYPRNGYGGLFFHCDYGPAAYKEARHALAYLIDRNEVVNHVCGGYAVVTNGEYGLAQWMYQENEDAITRDLHVFSLDYEKANELLDQTPWKFEADGKTPFDPAKAGSDTNYYRHNSKGEVLAWYHLGTEENSVTDSVELQLMAHTPYAGIKFELTRSDFAHLLDHYYEAWTYDAKDRKYHSFNLANSFSEVYDPYYSYHSDWFESVYYNPTMSKDPVLDEKIMAMRSKDPSDLEGYSAAWLEWQKAWNDYLPVIPLYSNQYHDIFGTHVKGVSTTPFLDWSESICDIYIER